MELTNLRVKVNSNLKKEADDLFQKLGMDTNTAINTFLTQCVKEQAIPFIIRDNRSNKRYKLKYLGK